MNELSNEDGGAEPGGKRTGKQGGEAAVSAGGIGCYLPQQELLHMYSCSMGALSWAMRRREHVRQADMSELAGMLDFDDE